MTETTWYQRNKDVIIKKAKHYYENDEKRLREQARYKYRKLSEEKKKREYGRNRYHNMSKKRNKN